MPRTYSACLWGCLLVASGAICLAAAPADAQQPSSTAQIPLGTAPPPAAVPRLEFAFEFRVTLAPAVVLGETVFGRRMPSHQHEALLQLFRNRPSLAPELLCEALQMELPEYSDIRIDSADLTDIQPAEYRADLVVLLLTNRPVMGIIVEVQLSKDGDKGYAWPAYVFNLRSRLRCPAWVLVIAADEAVARWALTAVEAGVGDCCRFLPWVLGLSGVPEITDESRAIEDPELAFLSAMAHGHDPDTAKSTRIALLAQIASLGLDAERSTLYCDLLLNALPETARRALLLMDTSKYEYQSEFARRYFAQGKAEGQARGEIEGQVALILRLLAVRYGSVSPTAGAHVRNATHIELTHIADRLLTARTLEEALGTPTL